MTTLTFEAPFELVKLAGVLAKLNEITPNTYLHISLKVNRWVTKIAIFPAVPAEKKGDMERLAKEIGATLEM